MLSLLFICIEQARQLEQTPYIAPRNRESIPMQNERSWIFLDYSYHYSPYTKETDVGKPDRACISYNVSLAYPQQ